jgi:hypothetical protein
MKILLYTGYRTGSRSLGDWLSIELNIDYHHEPFNINNPIAFEKYNNFSLNDIDDCVIKISPKDDLKFEDIISKFDKVIVLYRNNIKEQAESFIWSKHKKIYHHSYVDDKFVYAHYKIDDDFLLNNSNEINQEIQRLEIENEYIKSLNYGLLLTYEELYFSEMGLKKLEDYLNVKFKTKLNPIHKLRNGFIKKSLT